jgi:HEPN domain-containing protein
LALARVHRPAGVLFEGLCFHAQQAAEKAVKAVLLTRGVPVPQTHDIGRLLDLLLPDMVLPAQVRQAAGLTEYADSSRYPGDFEPVEETEYREAVRLAEAVVSWAETIIPGKT